MADINCEEREVEELSSGSTADSAEGIIIYSHDFYWLITFEG